MSISSNGLKETMKELNVVIYNYFREMCRTLDNVHNRQLSMKYKDKNSIDLKRILEVLEQLDGDIEEIKFVSRSLQKKFVSIAESSSKPKQKNAQFQWERSQQEEFEKLKKALL